AITMRYYRARQILTAALVLGSLGMAGLAVAKDPAEPKKPANPAPSSVWDQTRFINESLAAAWKANKLTPSRRIDDYEFIRRVSLDIIGRIAKPGEIELYFRDPPNSRRALLIERLLQSEDYSKNWSHLWSTWLLSRTGQKRYRDQMLDWLE